MLIWYYRFWWRWWGRHCKGSEGTVELWEIWWVHRNVPGKWGISVPGLYVLTQRGSVIWDKRQDTQIYKHTCWAIQENSVVKHFQFRIYYICFRQGLWLDMSEYLKHFRWIGRKFNNMKNENKNNQPYLKKPSLLCLLSPKIQKQKTTRLFDSWAKLLSENNLCRFVNYLHVYTCVYCIGLTSTVFNIFTWATAQSPSFRMRFTLIIIFFFFSVIVI